MPKAKKALPASAGANMYQHLHTAEAVGDGSRRGAPPGGAAHAAPTAGYVTAVTVTVRPNAGNPALREKIS